VAVSFDYGYEPSGSIKCGKFLHKLSDYCLLEKNSAPWSDLVIKEFLFRTQSYVFGPYDERG
jgi:hypothetical protein